MIIFLLLFFFLHDINAAGFEGHTLLLTKHSHITFDKANLNTLIHSHENTFKHVLFIAKKSVAKVVQLSIADETITCHKKQRFWCVNKNNWVRTKDFLPGDLLETVDGLQIPIDEINIIERQTELYFLTVGPPHYLYIGKNGVLAHNMTWFVGIGVELALECGAIEFIKATFTVVAGAIALHFAKNKNKKKPKMAISVQPVCNAPLPDPNNDKNKYTYKNGIYEDADYHTRIQNGLKSPRPKDGQKALDNSYEVHGTNGQRVAIEGNKFVILRKTIGNIYHGHTTTWQELLGEGSKHQGIINTLVNNGLVKRSGKII